MTKPLKLEKCHLHKKILRPKNDRLIAFILLDAETIVLR